MSDSRGRAVPSGRLARFARFGGMAGGVAGSVIAGGARQLIAGERPELRTLLLSPANARRVADQLAQLRGAAMKLGQLISMDAGDVLPPELSDIFARLRAEAQHMPERQLRAVLESGWGRGWERRLRSFGFTPIAAASIGQVHRAKTLDGRDLAIKVQYPGVRESIDSDVDNVATLLRLSGLVPAELNVAPLLTQAKRQLHDEADYSREAKCLQQFGDLLAGDDRYIVPSLAPELCTDRIMAMSYQSGVAIESLTSARQDVRDDVLTRLIDLLFRELFDFGLMQTDPNFANYRVASDGRIILLDFGATCPIAPDLAAKFARLAAAGERADRAAIGEAILDIGYFGGDTAPHHRDAIIDLFMMTFEAIIASAGFDFGSNDLAMRLRDGGMKIAAQRDFWHVPPADTLLVQRKFGGLFLLATRLKARVKIAPLLARSLSTPLAA